MADTKVLFSKSSDVDRFESMLEKLEGSSQPEKPPTYEESAATSGFAKASTSSGSNGSIHISLDKMAVVTGANGSASGSTVSVDQVQDELSALQRAQLHLYKRLQHVKSQTYAALALVLLMAGIIVIFLATYHTDKSGLPLTAVSSHRTGKALVGGGDGASASLLSSNSIVGDDETTEALLKHLSKIVTSTTIGMANGVTTATTKASSTSFTDDNLLLLKAKEMLRSDHGLVDRIGRPDHSQPPSGTNDRVMGVWNVESSTVTTTSTTTTTTTSTTPSPTTATMTTTEEANETDETVTEKVVTTAVMSGVPVALHDTYNISLVVHSATVPNMDYLPLGRASDTYCDVFIDDVLIGSTPIVDNNNNPNWQYLLPRSYKVRKDSSIRVDLLDRDHLKKDHIGGVVIMVGDLVNTGRVNRPVKFFHGRGDVWVTVKLV